MLLSKAIFVALNIQNHGQKGKWFVINQPTSTHWKLPDLASFPENLLILTKYERNLMQAKIWEERFQLDVKFSFKANNHLKPINSVPNLILALKGKNI